MQAQNYSELERQITKAVCPTCGHGLLAFRLRCDIGSGGCLRFVSCGRCATLFRLNMAAEKLATDSAHLHDLLEAFSCTHCGGNALALELRCSLATGESSYSIACQSCGRSTNGTAPRN